MLDEVDTFPFVLAEALGGMTVEEMSGRMSNLEFQAWRAFFVYRAEMQELERK